MKLLHFILLISVLQCFTLSAQVSINADGQGGHPSAALDVRFPDRGFLPPRMTKSEMMGIASPAEGLVVVCTDCGTGSTGVLCMFAGGSWTVVTTGCIPPLAPEEGTSATAATQITWEWQPVRWATGYRWNSVNNYSSAIDTDTVTSRTESGLQCNTAYTRFVWAYNDCDHSAADTLTATTTMSSPGAPPAGTHSATSSQITWNWGSVSGASGYKWNNTDNYATATDMGTATSKTEGNLACSTSYTRYVWAYSSCGHSTSTMLTKSTLANPPSPVAGTHVATATQITWNWNTVAGATGYKWSTTNNYTGATNMGTATSKTESGLTCNTTYTRYIWAYNACGYSTVTMITFTTAACQSDCPLSVTDPRDGQTYPAVQIGTQCWMAANMNIGVRIPGVAEQMNNGILEKYCYNDLDSLCGIYGGLYQWGEAVQYANGASNYTTWVPPPVGPVQGICPPGWHVPTTGEWDILAGYLGGASIAGGKLKEAGTDHWAAPNTGATNESGFTGLPGGFRTPDGMFTELTYSGYFWTSTGLVTTAYARQLFFNSEALITLVPPKVLGYSVRCLKNDL